MGETQALVTIIPWTFLAQICNLFIQVYLIRRFLFRPVMKILDQRREQANRQIREAEEARQEAREIKADYESRISGAKQQAQAILETARKSAQEQADQQIREAKEQAEHIREKAEAEIALERKKAVSEMKSEIGGLAMDIAGKVVEREFCEKDHQKLIREFIENAGEAS